MAQKLQIIGVRVAQKLQNLENMGRKNCGLEGNCSHKGHKKNKGGKGTKGERGRDNGGRDEDGRRGENKGKRFSATPHSRLDGEGAFG
jgi:hypothetical protein